MALSAFSDKCQYSRNFKFYQGESDFGPHDQVPQRVDSRASSKPQCQESPRPSSHLTESMLIGVEVREPGSSP
jgi:hypothetical protein